MHSGKNLFLRIVAFALLSLMAGICVAELKVTHAWVKLAPPSSTVNAAYMQLTNESPQPQVVTQISADCCAMTMLHKTRYEQDRAIMDHLTQLTIPAQTTVELKPGDLHIMLMKPHKPLALNDSIIVTLTFADGTQQLIPLFVKRDSN